MKFFERRNAAGSSLEKYEKYAHVLKKTKWGKEFCEEHIKQICSYIEPVKAMPGAIVFKQGDKDKSLGIIVKGAIDILKENTRVTTLTSSQTFGEMALIDGEPRSASGIAAEETVIFFMSQDNLIRLTQDNPQLGIRFVWKISRIISQRLRRTTGMLVDYMG